MAHGGRRQGAGRPVGTGSPLTALRTLRGKERAESIGYLRALAGTADDPARIALDIARDPAVDVRLRIDCAVALVPFVHPKLSYVETSNTHFSVHADADTVLVELESRLDRLSQKPPEIRGEIQETDCLSVGEEAESLGLPDGYDSASTSVSALCPREAA